MAIKKIDVIKDAYAKIRISGLTLDPTPEATTVALEQLEGMMAELEATSMNINYQFEEEPDPNTDTGVRLEHKQMMSSNVAMRVVSNFGKEIPLSLEKQANQSLSNSNSIVAAAQITQVQYPDRMARGSGNTVKWNRWFRYFNSEITPPTDSNIIVRGDTRDYQEFYTAFLINSDFIASFTIQADTGLTLISSSNSDTTVSYRLNADIDKDTMSFRQVKIIITTDQGKVLTRLIDFNIRDNDTVGEPNS